MRTHPTAVFTLSEGEPVKMSETALPGMEVDVIPWQEVEIATPPACQLVAVIGQQERSSKAQELACANLSLVHLVPGMLIGGCLCAALLY